MLMIRKRSIQYTSRKSYYCKRGNSSKLNSSILKKNDHSISCFKTSMLKTKSCTKKTRVRKSALSKRGRTVQKASKNWPALKFSGEKFSHLCNRRSLVDADGDGRIRRVKRRKKQKTKAIMLDEASRLQRRTRYLLLRMKLEQNLIDAYSAEGWKGQSREKIKPEKELQRARKQILNCKLGIRDAIHQLELLSSEGCIEDSMIYPDGSVHHEHIFCAKCKSREAFPDNDIILCDGSCNCAFHQKCLEPPLAKIPPGDQGWFCKYCDCKMEILEAINAHLGTFFSIESSWEDIFKEAVTGPDGVNKLDPSLEWPSEDSEDDDYNPENNEKSSSMTSIEDDVSDVDSSFSSIFHSSSEDSSESRRPLKDDSDDTGDHATKSYRRQRRDVDYKQLYVEMFGKDQNENEQSDDEDWGPHRRKQRRLESNDPTDLGSSGDADQRPELQSSRNIEKKLPSTLQERKPLFRIPRDAVERLRQVFAKNELPSRAVKEDLSKQLGLTAEKVSKWFKNARYAALRIRKVEGTEVLNDYIKLNTKIRKKQSAHAATPKDIGYLLTSSSRIHVPRNLRKRRWRNDLKSTMPPLRKQDNRAGSTLPPVAPKANNYFDEAKLSNQDCSRNSPFERSASKKHHFHCASETRDNEDLYLSEMERLCNLQEKIMKLKMALGACKGCVINEPQSGEQPVIYVPVAEVKEKA